MFSDSQYVEWLFRDYIQYCVCDCVVTYLEVLQSSNSQKGCDYALVWLAIVIVCKSVGVHWSGLYLTMQWSSLQY